MEFNQMHKNDPSTSDSKVAHCDTTPKRSSIIHKSLTPLHSIEEENVDISDKEKNQSPLIRNPFDVKAESLYYPSCSPSVFATFARNKSNDGTLRWSIDHLSILYPAEIDETSIPEHWDESCQDAKVQKAIDTFFSQNSIVPSPWSSSPSKKEKNDLKVRRMTRIGSMFQDCKNDNCDVTTQTMLSIPPDVDLRHILGNFFSTEEENESISSKESSRDEMDSLSTSSLRRKLFATEEECQSPCKIQSKVLLSAKRWRTPSLRGTQLTPASDVLSSSPISPPICSDSCNIMCSPPVSPIAAGTSPIGLKYASFCDQTTESPAKPYHQSFTESSETAMSFCAESQDTNAFPSNQSERQDTGYVTGSICSSQNITSSEINCLRFSRITPVTELMEECELSNSVSCDVDMSYKKDCLMTSEVASFDSMNKIQEKEYNFRTYPWAPTSSSTPSQSFAFES